MLLVEIFLGLLPPRPKCSITRGMKFSVAPQGLAFLAYLSFFSISLRVVAVPSSRAAFGKALSAHGCAKEMSNPTSLPESGSATYMSGLLSQSRKRCFGLIL